MSRVIQESLTIQEHHDLTIQALTPLCDIKVDKFLQDNRYCIGLVYKGIKIVFDTTVDENLLSTTRMYEKANKRNAWIMLASLNKHPNIIRENVHKWVQEDLDKIYNKER